LIVLTEHPDCESSAQATEALRPAASSFNGDELAQHDGVIALRAGCAEAQVPVEEATLRTAALAVAGGTVTQGVTHEDRAQIEPAVGGGFASTDVVYGSLGTAEE
jgi:hypothetical protein